MRDFFDIAGFESDHYGNRYNWFLAYVEQVYEAEDVRGADHLVRVAIRILGYHDEGAQLDDLPLATPLMPTTLSTVYDIGGTPGLEVGAFVVGFWLDRHRQHPCVIGALSGITPRSMRQWEDIFNVVQFPQSGTSGADASVEDRIISIPVGGDGGGSTE